MVIDGDRGIRQLLRVVLEPQGYRVWLAENAAVGLQWVAEKQPHVVILETNLPDIDGLTVLQTLTQSRRARVLVLSERRAEMEKVRAFDSGADDYMTKPFSNAELLARLRALRRPVSRALDGPFLIEGQFIINLASRKVTFRGSPTKFTPIEEALFSELLCYSGKVVTFSHLLRCIWGTPAGDGIRGLRVHVAHLRERLEASDARVEIKCEDGIGYWLHDLSAQARPIVADRPACDFGRFTEGLNECFADCKASKQSQKNQETAKCLRRTVAPA